LLDSFRFWEVAAWREWGQRVREIELKYRVEDLEAVLLALKSRGIELSEPFFQDDQAYAPAGGSSVTASSASPSSACARCRAATPSP
jgi:hypothetical protein